MKIKYRKEKVINIIKNKNKMNKIKINEKDKYICNSNNNLKVKRKLNICQKKTNVKMN